MKTSTAHLPRHKRKELDQIVGIARAVVPGLEMVILYGSYARGDYVKFDMREEFGVPTTFVSDYDLLLVTSKNGVAEQEFTLGEKIEQVFNRGKNEWLTPELQVIVEHIDHLNEQISRSHYFFSDIRKEGVMLWNSGNYKLARRKKLNYTEIRQYAQEYYDGKFILGMDFLFGVKVYYDAGKYVTASFLLHQAAENFIKTILLTFTLYAPKYHALRKLRLNVRPHVPEVAALFPVRTKAEKKLFDLLCDAYVEARYNPNFVVTKEDMDALIPRVERLRDIVEKACLERIGYYRQMQEVRPPKEAVSPQPPGAEG